MPYGLPNETPAITAKMEACVSDVMKQGKSKDSAIAICKSQIMDSKGKESSLIDKMRKMMARKSKEFRKFVKDGEKLRIAVVQSKNDRNIELNQSESKLEIEEKEDEWRIKGVFITNKVNLNNVLYTGEAIKKEVNRLNEKSEILPIYKDHEPKNGVFGVWDSFSVEENGEEVNGIAEGVLFKKKYAVKDLWTDINELNLETGISWGGYSINPGVEEMNGVDVRVADEIEAQEISITEIPADTKCELEVLNKSKSLDTNNKGQNNTINNKKSMSKKEEKKAIEKNEEEKEEEVKPVVETKEDEKKEEEAPKEEDKKEEKAENSVSLKLEELNQLKKDSEELKKIKEKQAYDELKKEVNESFKLEREKEESAIKLFKKLSKEERQLVKELASTKETKSEDLGILSAEMVQNKDMSNKSEEIKIKEYAEKNNLNYKEATDQMREKKLI